MASNSLERRMKLLSEKLERMNTIIYNELTNPKPYGQVKISEDDQLDKYLELEQQGKIGELRRSNGGPYPDDEVDNYSIRMENLKARRLGGHVLSSMEGPREEYDQEESDY